MADLIQLMLNPYVVIRAGSLLHHAVDMLSLPYVYTKISMHCPFKPRLLHHWPQKARINE